MKVICYIAHDQLANSSSQQFLKASGQALTSTEYVDLTQELQEKESFNSAQEIARMSNYDCVLFQFPLYWYQAPSILKIWMDQVFNDQLDITQTKKLLKGKAFGIILIIGAKTINFQPGGQAGVTIPDLLSPYYAWSQFFQMNYLTPFIISQFQFLSEKEQYHLMVDYATYLKTGQIDRLGVKTNFLLNELNKLHLDLDPVDQLIYEQFIQKLREQADELSELQFFEE